MYEKKKGQPYYTNRHSCFLLQYHMVLVTKYRHPVLTGGVRDVVYGTIRDIFAEKGLVILEMNGEMDHVHILYEADPFTAPGSLANIVKTKTSRFARKEYGETVLRKYYWKPYFWSDSYFVTTVSIFQHFRRKNRRVHAPFPPALALVRNNCLFSQYRAGSANCINYNSDKCDNRS